ncbi:uncharacterized protein LOC143076203 isoform X2 [Mytilus galloprovincialis]|uniref:uncharacterized protein LOC143076203 isoform X2 n=1 Tax=Mytilus galloprovincialis TaxID=29158 RepID=UPI003F7BD4AD
MTSSSSSAVPGSCLTNYARIGHAAQQLFPDILQELITIKEPPHRLSGDVNTNKNLSKILRSDELLLINDVATKGYANFDIPFIYKLIRNLNLVPPPTLGWSHPTAPCLTEVTPGDDIERIRRFRNETLHRGNAQVTDTELSQIFTQFKDIGGRLETYMGKQTGEFVDKFVDLETCCMDEDTRTMYIERLDRLKKSDEDCKKRLSALEEDVDALKEKNSSTTHLLDTMATEIPSEESNYIKISLLILKISQHAVRLKFDTEFHPDCLQETLNRSSGKLRELQRMNRINQHQWTLLFPSKGKPSSEKYDITLMINLIRNLTDIQISSKLPLPTRVSVGDDLSRIQYYRNKIAHMDSFMIEDDDFNIYWEDIAQALHRLSGGSFNEEIIELQEWQIFESQKSNSLRHIQMQNRLVAAEDQLVAVEEQLVSVTKRMMSLELQLNDPIPKNIKDLYEKEIKHWVEDKEKFFETAAAKKILGFVTENSVTVIAGSSGMGKTATSHQIALHLQQHEGYQILPISDPKDIEKYYTNGLAQIFVFDNLCGVFNVDQHLINSWDRVSSQIARFCKENKHFRILATCRLQITKNPQFEKLSDKLNMKECNLLSKDLAYKNSEKLKIASCHMDQEHVHNLSRETISGLDMFPFLCDMFGKSDNKDMKMFEWPIQYYEEQFDQMQYQNEECFLGLGLLVIYNDTIKINVFKDESIDTVFKKIFKEVFESLELSNRPSKLQVLRKLDTLIDTYITSYIENNQSIITSKHDLVFDLLSLYFGKKMTKTLVKYATPDFISDRIQFESLEEEHDEYIIMIPPYLEHSYFNRMEEEIMKNNFYGVFGNMQSHIKLYQEKFIDFFSKKTDIMEKLLHNRWPLYLSSMNGCSIFVQFLLEQQNNIPSELLQDISDRTRFEIAAHDSDTEDIDTDSDMYKITHKNAPLVEACTEGHLQIVQTLVQYGYDIDCVEPGLLSPLYAACTYGHTDIVQYLLGCNCAVDLKNCDGQTALHVACIKNNPEIVSILLGKGLYINKPGFCKETPFFIACKWGNLGVVNILLEYNCDITICNNMNESPLHEACKNGHKDIVEVLIRNKCDVDMVNLFGRTALHEACSSNYTQFLDEEDETWSIEGEEVDIQYYEPKVQYGKTVIVDKISDSIETIQKGIVQILLHTNINPCIVDYLGYTALHEAAKSGYSTIVDILLQKLLEMNKMALVNEYKPVDLYKSFIPPLFSSSSKCVVNVFVQHTCNMNILDSHGRNALHYASERGHLEIVEFLYDIGCKMDVLNASGKSVLHAACRGGNEDIVDFFLKRGCDPNHTDKYGDTPLFVACARSNIEVVKVLIKYHCDVNKTNIGGCNALQKACLNGRVNIVDLLLKNKININQADNLNNTPLFYACYHGYKDVASLLMENKSELNIPNKDGQIVLHLSCWLGHLEITQLLLQNHSNINQPDKSKCTPLHLAATEGYNDIVELLIKNGCDINACDVNGRNALHHACIQKVEHDYLLWISHCSKYNRQEHYHNEVVVLLLQNKCDANQEDSFGQIPLHIACETCTSHRYLRCMTDIVKLLLESGCDIDKCDNSHRSPFLIACEKKEYESEKIVTTLVENNCDVNIKDNNGQTGLEICTSKGFTWVTEILLHSQNSKNEATQENA